MSANSIRITSLVNIAAFLVRQTVVLLWNYFSEDNDPYFMIILSRIRIDEEMIDRVTVEMMPLPIAVKIAVKSLSTGRQDNGNAPGYSLRHKLYY